MTTFVDNVPIQGYRETQDGYLVAEVRCARTGLQDYLGVELGVDSPVVSVYRSEDEVFNHDSLASFVGKPTTDDHPTEPVTADNWKQYAVGSVGESVMRDGEFIRVPITLMDKAIIDKVKQGKVEISMGYTADVEFGDGVTKEGMPYQARQKNIRINHLAIVDRGRAGSQCRIGDNATPWGKSPIINDTRGNMKHLIVDGLTIETTEASFANVQKIVDAKGDAELALKDAKTQHEQALALKDADLAAKDAEIAALKEAQLTDAELDAKVQARTDLLNTAKLIADFDTAGLSDAEIRKQAVETATKTKLDDKSEAYVDAMFDILAKNATKENEFQNDSFRQAMFGDGKTKTPTVNSQEEYETRLETAYLNAGA